MLLYAVYCPCYPCWLHTCLPLLIPITFPFTKPLPHTLPCSSYHTPTTLTFPITLPYCSSPVALPPLCRYPFTTHTRWILPLFTGLPRTPVATRLVYGCRFCLPAAVATDQHTTRFYRITGYPRFVPRVATHYCHVPYIHTIYLPGYGAFVRLLFYRDSLYPYRTLRTVTPLPFLLPAAFYTAPLQQPDWDYPLLPLHTHVTYPVVQRRHHTATPYIRFGFPTFATLHTFYTTHSSLTFYTVLVLDYTGSHTHTHTVLHMPTPIYLPVISHLHYHHLYLAHTHTLPTVDSGDTTFWVARYPYIHTFALPG